MDNTGSFSFSAMLIYQVAQAIRSYYEYPVSTWVQSGEIILSDFT